MLVVSEFLLWMKFYVKKAMQSVDCDFDGSWHLSYVEYISTHSASSHVSDFSGGNKFLTAKLLKQ